MAGATGLEPATFGVTGRQFNLQIQALFRLFERPRRTEIGLESEHSGPTPISAFLIGRYSAASKSWLLFQVFRAIGVAGAGTAFAPCRFERHRHPSPTCAG
jgi:hypothetical protein